MKKKLLFVIPTLDLGGAEKSLVNLLHSIDYTKYDVDLFLFIKRGVFLKSVPKEVHIIENSNKYNLFAKSVFVAIPLFMLSGKFFYAYHRFLFAIKNRYVRNVSMNEQYTWKHAQKFLPNLTEKYDVAIGYLEKSTYYFVIDNTVAKKKIGWIHTDLEALKLDFSFEENYFNKLDYIITVSDGLKERLTKKLTSVKEKTFSIENINSVKSIRFFSEEKPSVILNKDFFTLIFVGRLVKEKGLFMAIDAVKILLQKNCKVKLYLVGKGNQEKELKKYVLQNNLQDNIKFLGLQSNPYSLIKQADVFLMTSFYEGKSIALEEAKILLKPILITNFTSAKDQIKDTITGLIADMNPESIAEKLLSLYKDESLRQKLIANLEREQLGNENEIQKLYKLIN